MSTTVSNIYYQQQQYIKGYRGDTLEWEVPQGPDYVYIKKLGSDQGIFTIKQIGTSRYYGTTLEYSFDKTNWTLVTFDASDQNTCRITVPANSKVYLRSNDWFSTSDSDYYTLSCNFPTEVGGDLLTLCKYTGNAYAYSYNFYNMFKFNSVELDASRLKFPNAIPSYCCANMFSGCTGLYAAPDLSTINAAQSHAFDSMFSGCSQLTTIKLPNNQNSMGTYCYANMFHGCVNLTTIIGNFSEYVQEGCYNNMFYGCRSLVTAPALPATNLARYCYQGMFQNCSSLVNAPSELPALDTLGSNNYVYAQMFSGCTSLVEAPIIKATNISINAATEMFKGCTSLNKVVIYSTSTWRNQNNWLSNVAQTGDFYNLGQITIPSGNSGIPYGWTEHTSL